MARLDTVLTYRDKETQKLDKVVRDDNICDIEESDLVKELESVRAVLEIKAEEVRKLRQELDMRQGWREDKGTMTEELEDQKNRYRLW